VAPGSIPRHGAHRHERGVILADALEMLPDDCREVIILRHLEGRGFSEVARLMGRTEDGARRVWLRALALLGRTLEGLG
jgi:RNA polymerase sigma factor (sigma-70 family)